MTISQLVLKNVPALRDTKAYPVKIAHLVGLDLKINNMEGGIWLPKGL
jgi:hypothetical protein